MKAVFVAVVVAMLAGCASAPPVAPLVVTRSGLPERVVKNTNIEDTKAAVIENCMNKQYSVEENGNTVVCSKEMTGGAAVMIQMAIGNSYADTPRRNFKFMLLKQGSNTKIMASAFASTRMINGKVNTLEMKNQAVLNSVQVFLETIPDGV